MMIGKNFFCKSSKKQENLEFPYIDEVLKTELEGKHIFIDPGKRSLFSMMDDEGNFFSYTNKMYLKETKRLKYQNLLENYKKKIGIKDLLKIYNSKSCDIDKEKTQNCVDMRKIKQPFFSYSNLPTTPKIVRKI